MTSFEKIGWWVETPRYSQSEWGEEYAVGRALISPKRSKGNLDNYRFMREVQRNAHKSNRPKLFNFAPSVATRS